MKLEQIKKNPAVHTVLNFLYTVIIRTSTIISPKLNTIINYRHIFHRKINLKHPDGLNEKIQWLKLYDYPNNQLVIDCADKIKVREYVKKCGCGEILTNIIGVYDKPKDIVWEELPNKFALKWNFGSGMNIICTDKSLLNEKEVKRKLKKWGRYKYWLYHSEMHYKRIKRKIICEELIDSNDED